MQAHGDAELFAQLVQLGVAAGIDDSNSSGLHVVLSPRGLTAPCLRSDG